MRDLVFIALVVSLSLIACKPPSLEVPKAKPSDIAKSINEVVGVCLIQPERGMIDIASKQSGLVADVLVKENDFVEQGDVLMILDQALTRAQVNQFESKLESAKNDVLSARIELIKIKEEYSNDSILAYQADQNFKVGAISEQERKRQALQANQTKRKLENAEISEIKSESKFSEAQNDLRYYKELLSQYEIRAPFNGQIIKWKKQEGEFCTLGEAVGEFSPTAPLVAKVEVDELFADKVNLNNRADIYSPSTGEIVASGYVSFISAYLSSKSIFADESNKDERRVRQVIISLNSPSNVLIGMKLDVKIYLGK